MYLYKNKKGETLKSVKPISKVAQKLLGMKSIRKKVITNDYFTKLGGLNVR